MFRKFRLTVVSPEHFYKNQKKKIQRLLDGIFGLEEDFRSTPRRGSEEWKRRNSLSSVLFLMSRYLNRENSGLLIFDRIIIN